MTSFFKTAAAAALTGTALFLSAPARADDFSVSIGVPGVAFSYDSGGFCDSWGCPGDYWDYPVYYGPVYYDDEWFDGPVYYRVIDGDYWYWVHGGWHRDQWHGPRPHWWGHYRYGPALGYTFYSGHGFHHGHDRYWHGADWHPGRDNGWHGDHRGWDRHDGGDGGRFDRGDGDHGDRGDRDRGGHGHGGHGHGGDRRGHD